jgi:RecA/RadA recombinase
MARGKSSAPKTPEKKISALAKRFEAVGSKSPDVALPELVSIQTRFIQYDWATRVGGHPLARATTIHGPSNEGKTAFMIGLGASFVEAGGVCDLVDAERTTTKKWLLELVGEVANSDRFRARRPDTYEQCVDETRELHRLVKQMREDGDLPKHASVITLVDSLGRLVPEDIAAKIRRFGAEGEKGSVDGMGGASAMIMAKMNKDWFQELVPLLDSCSTSWACVTRESQKMNASKWEKDTGNDYHVIGGRSVIYDAALVNRIERDDWVVVEREGKKVVLGERHRITVKKTKIGGKEGRATIAYFHTSNGTDYEPGFDRARDVVELGLKLGVLVMRGNRVGWPSMSETSSWAGRESCMKELRGAPADLANLEAEVRARFSAAAPETEPEMEQEQ